MNILLTGKIDSIALHLISAVDSNRIIVASNNIPPGELPNNARPFSIGPTDPLFERVIKVGSFDAAVFFMARGEHTDKSDGGVTAFQSLLEYCADNDVHQIVLVTSGEVFSGLSGSAAISETTPTSPKGAQGYQIKAAEDMCQQYWQRSKGNSQSRVTVVRLPYIYQTKDAAAGDGLFANLFKVVLDGSGRFELPGTPDTRCDFLSDVEAARLIYLILDESVQAKFNLVNAGTGKDYTFNDVAALIGQHFPDISLRFSGDTSDVPMPMRTKVARSEYGWNVLHSLEEDFVEIKKTIVAAPVRKFPQISKLLRRFAKFFRGSKAFIVLEFAVATALLQLLTKGLEGFTFASWIDLRLLFVVILGTLHGTVSGIVSGIIAGVMLFLSLSDTDWRIIVYNPENWIPFALYVIMGVALGSKADRQRDNIESTQERLVLAEQTNVYLVDLYDEAVRIKDKYRDQILGYRDNFGRIYTIVKKLNAEMSEYVFSSAIEVLEDVLENNTVAIYSMSANGAFARMTVCSKSFYNTTMRSMRLEDFPQLLEKINQNEVWFNRDLLHGFPSYCAPVYNDDKVIALVMIWKAEVDQMSLHYSNLFKILSGLIQESLARAVKFHKLQETKMFFPDTRILMEEPFWAAYRANMSLAEQERAAFGLVAVKRTSAELAEQSVQLEACIRESDIAGAVNDDLFCVILKNVSGDDIQFLLQRFEAHDLNSKQITAVDMQELSRKEKKFEDLVVIKQEPRKEQPKDTPPEEEKKAEETPVKKSRRRKKAEKKDAEPGVEEKSQDSPPKKKKGRKKKEESSPSGETE